MTRMDAEDRLPLVLTVAGAMFAFPSLTHFGDAGQDFGCIDLVEFLKHELIRDCLFQRFQDGGVN